MVVAILTVLAGIIWGLYRLHNSGVDLNAFNPFYWLRRRQWQNLIHSKPLHAIENPLEAAAVLLVATAKLDGEITRELKHFVIQLFITEFSITEQSANELFATSSYLLRDADNIIPEVRLILAPSKAAFKPHQIATLVEMLHKVAGEESSPTVAQTELILEVRKHLAPTKDNKLTWE